MAEIDCHFGDHNYGPIGQKPVSTCQDCYRPNHQLRGYIGWVTRLSRRWGCSWEEAEQRLEDEAERELDELSGPGS